MTLGTLSMGTLLRRGSPRAVLLAAWWWILTAGDPSSWTMGVPAIVLATLVSVALLPPMSWHWRGRGMLRFLPYFLRYSISGGIDVARRAFTPQLPLAPELIHYPIRLPPGAARIFFINTISLLPGTLSVALRDEHVIVHALNVAESTVEQLRTQEAVIADLFGVPLPSGRAS